MGSLLVTDIDHIIAALHKIKATTEPTRATLMLDNGTDRDILMDVTNELSKIEAINDQARLSALNSGYGAHLNALSNVAQISSMNAVDNNQNAIEVRTAGNLKFRVKQDGSAMVKGMVLDIPTKYPKSIAVSDSSGSLWFEEHYKYRFRWEANYDEVVDWQNGPLVLIQCPSANHIIVLRSINLFHYGDVLFDAGEVEVFYEDKFYVTDWKIFFDNYRSMATHQPSELNMGFSGVQGKHIMIDTTNINGGNAGHTFLLIDIEYEIYELPT